MLYKKYKGGGAPAYDPAMMLKILVFGYCHGVRSSRKIDTALGHDQKYAESALNYGSRLKL
jgi:transposase